MASGLFAEYGLLVEILDPPPPPGTTNPHRVATGGADFCLTGVTYYLQALEEAGAGYPARFVSMVHQRSPLGAIVAGDSRFVSPGDLAGGRLGRVQIKDWLADEFCQALRDRGLDVPASVHLESDPDRALASDDIDMVPTFVDAINSVRARGSRPVRAIHVGGEFYATGLVAADRLPHDLVCRMRAAVAAALEHQARDPEAGIAEYLERYPRSRAQHALEGWTMFAAHAIPGTPGTAAGAMDQQRWTATLAWLTQVHNFPCFPPEAVYRPELATPAALDPRGLAPARVHQG